MRLVVSNTGPVLHLHEAQVLSLLSLAGEVHISNAVASELQDLIESWQTTRPAWVRVQTLDPARAAQAAAWQQAGLLDAGEAEALALARQLSADWLLTDDAAARLLGQMLGLEVHGSLGVLLWAAAVGHLSREEAGAALDRLGRSSLWISARVLAEAKVALAELGS